MRYDFDWGDGSQSAWTPFVASGTDVSQSHSWSAPGTYAVKVEALDYHGERSGWSYPAYITISSDQPNRAPDTPEAPDGPSSGQVGTVYTFLVMTTDPDGDRVDYWIDWGDGSSDSGESDLWDSGVWTSWHHAWSSPGTYHVRAKAKDEWELDSDWSPSSTITIVDEATEPSMVVHGGTEVSDPYSSTCDDPITVGYLLDYIIRDPQPEGGVFGELEVVLEVLAHDPNTGSTWWFEAATDVQGLSAEHGRLNGWLTSTSSCPGLIAEYRVVVRFRPTGVSAFSEVKIGTGLVRYD